MSSEKHIWLKWPISIRFCWDRRLWAWFTWHGIEALQPYYFWVYHLGPLRIVFGESQGEFIRRIWHEGHDNGRRYERMYGNWEEEARSHR